MRCRPRLELAADAADATGLESAFDAARWIASTATDSDSGTVWLADAADPKSIKADLYHGACGPTLFAAALHRVALTDEQRTLARSMLHLGCDFLARVVDGDGGVELGAGLYTGLAGIAFALFEAGTELQEGTESRSRARAAALRACDVIAGLAQGSSGANAKSASSWGSTTDVISGDAGIALFCLDALRHFEGDDERSAKLSELARATGEHLLVIGQRDGDGLSWPMTPSYPRRMPNFSHGTAGIAYFLARLAQHTGEQRFLDAAKSGAARLRELADERCFVHHHTPDGEELYYLGWCHGPAGTGRLFHLLGEVSGEPEWPEWLMRSAEALIESGIPEQRPDGFWNNVGVCCGSAGVAEHALDLHRSTGNEGCLALARKLTDDLLARGTRDEHGLRWRQAEHRSQPEFLQTQTGYMQGAAGIGILLLRWHAFERGQRLGLRLPDSPF